MSAGHGLIRPAECRPNKPPAFAGSAGDTPSDASRCRRVERSVKPWLGALILGLAGLLGGCKPLDIAKSASWDDSEAKAVVPTRMDAIWSETTLHQSGQRAVRGFGGRIMFYEHQEGDPVVVDGTLTVYAFDESHATGSEAAPARKYVFTPDQLSKHYSQSTLGHSYSVWIPWEEAGGPTRQISLVARFDATDGGIVMSDHSKQLLPGVAWGKSEVRSTASKTWMRDDEGARISDEGWVDDPSSPVPHHYHSSFRRLSPVTRHDSSVVQASHEAFSAELNATAGKPAAKESMSTVTIDVPANFVRRPIDVDSLYEEDGRQLPRANTLRQTGAGQESRGERTVATSLADAERPLTRGNQSLGTNEDSPLATRHSATTAAQSRRFVRPRFPARRVQSVRPSPDHLRTQPYPATWPSALPRTPRSGQTGQNAGWQSLPPNRRTDGLGLQPQD